MTCDLYRRCIGDACRHYLPPVAGSLVHGVPACVLAVVEANELVGRVGMGHAEVGRYLGVSDVRVHQIEAVALAKLRRRMKEAA